MVNQKHSQARAQEAGFTLVKLAIVMIIIGLLIGGILKGQELIGNAKIKSTVAQMKSFDAAFNTFKDQYNALPGDMLAPTTRLQNCAAAPCNDPGDGLGTRISTPAIGGAPALTDEGAVAFSQLLAAGLITGLDGTNNLQFGRALPISSLEGGYWVAYSAGGLPTAPAPAAASALAGHYLHFNKQIAAMGGGAGALSPAQAARIDRTLDDGRPESGVAIVANAGCMLAAGQYAEADTTQTCGLYFRILN